MAVSLTRVSASNAWDAAPVFSPDGSKLAWLAMKRPGYESDRLGIMVRDLKTGVTRELAPQWDRSAGQYRWSADGKTIYVVATDVGQQRLFALDAVKGGVPKPVTGPGYVSSFDLA